MCNVDISRTIPTTLFLKTKYLKYNKISFKFRAITNLSCVPLNPWLIPRINIQKSNLYRNGFIVKKLIYWSEHTHSTTFQVSQYVICDSKRSETQTIKCAVAQGSILGPLLFIIYMNDICNASELLFSIMYADGTSVQISVTIPPI